MTRRGADARADRGVQATDEPGPLRTGPAGSPGDDPGAGQPAGGRSPPEAVAAYLIGQSATNLREYRELVRIREDRYLLTMMQVEKSFIPYPDEPPVHFPPAAVWRELTAAAGSRSTRRAASGPRSRRRCGGCGRSSKADRPAGADRSLSSTRCRCGTSLQQLEKEHDLKFVVLEEAFRAAGDGRPILDKKPSDQAAA